MALNVNYHVTYTKEEGETMNYSQTLLTSLKASKDGISDYKAAQILGCSRQHISQIKTGIRFMSESMAIKAATMAGLDPKFALISLLEDRAENDEMREILIAIKEEISHIKH